MQIVARSPARSDGRPGQPREAGSGSRRIVVGLIRAPARRTAFSSSGGALSNILRPSNVQSQAINFQTSKAEIFARRTRDFSRVEWAPWGGQSGERELTVGPGFRKKEADGQAPHIQRRVQAPSRSGVPGR